MLKLNEIHSTFYENHKIVKQSLPKMQSDNLDMYMLKINYGITHVSIKQYVGQG